MSNRIVVKNRLSAAIASCLLVSSACTVYAQTGIQELIVTAQKREESLQDTPIAMSALSAAQLENRGITSFEGVAKASPSIAFTPYPNSSNLLILYMRGQGVSDPAQITSDGSVGLYQDGFYISRPQAATVDLADIERVEVLRGPQGTLYGRNTTGGAVNLISTAPSGEFGFKQSLTFGTRDRFRSLTTVDLPRWQNIAAKVSLLKSSVDGYVRNTGSSHDYGEEEQLAGRLSLNWELAPALMLDYFGEAGSLDSTPGYYQNPAWNNTVITVGGVAYPYHGNAGEPRSRTYRPIDLKLSTADFEGHGLTLSWDANDSLTLKSLTGYRELKWHAYQDFAEAFSYILSADPVLAFPVTFTSDNLVDSHQLSQEFQLVGSLERIDYIAGLYYFEENGASTGNGLQSVLGTDIEKFRYVTAEAHSEAAYTQATWTPPIWSDRLDLTLGARYTRDRREAERSSTVNGVMVEQGKLDGTANRQRFSKFNPMLTANYGLSEDISVYAKVATGYKAGGSSESGLFGHFDQTFDPETVTSYELGLKSYWWDHRLRINAAAFVSRFDDMQLAFTVDPTDTSFVQAYNAGQATVRGVELDLLLMPTETLSLSADYAYLDPEFDEVEALAGTTFDPAVNSAIDGVYSVGQNIKDLFALPYAPRHSLNLGMDYTVWQSGNASLAAHLDYQFQSSMFVTTTAGPDVPGRDNVEIPSHGLFNGRLTLTLDLPRGDQAKIALWGKNLTDKKYPLQAVGGGYAIATTGVLGNVGAGYVQSSRIWAEPAGFGVDLSYRY